MTPTGTGGCSASRPRTTAKPGCGAPRMFLSAGPRCRSRASSSASCDARARAGLIGKPGVTGAIGDAVQWPVAAKAKILFAGAGDRPAASFFAQLEQGAVLFAMDDLAFVACDRLIGK